MDYKKSGLCSTRVTFLLPDFHTLSFLFMPRSRGTHPRHSILLMPNSTVTTFWTLPNDTFKLPDNSHNNNVLFSFSNCSGLSVFVSVTAEFCLLLRLCSTTRLFPSLKFLHHKGTELGSLLPFHMHSTTSLKSLRCFFRASHNNSVASLPYNMRNIVLLRHYKTIFFFFFLQKLWYVSHSVIRKDLQIPTVKD
jgi:hypothetical protein